MRIQRFAAFEIQATSQVMNFGEKKGAGHEKEVTRKRGREKMGSGPFFLDDFDILF